MMMKREKRTMTWINTVAWSRRRRRDYADPHIVSFVAVVQTPRSSTSLHPFYSTKQLRTSTTYL